jgi:hypothetical protein
VSIQFQVSVFCDRCRAATTGVLVADRLSPSVAMHVQLPAGWSATTKFDSGELYVLCDACPADSTTLAPPAVAIHHPDPAGDSTLPPPPPKPHGA